MATGLTFDLFSLPSYILAYWCTGLIQMMGAWPWTSFPYNARNPPAVLAPLVTWEWQRLAYPPSSQVYVNESQVQRHDV